MLRWRLGIEYAGRTDLIGRALLRAQVSVNESCVSKLVSCMGYLTHFYASAGLLSSARTGILQRYCFYTGWSTMPVGTVVAMLYASMAGVANCTEGRLHWLQCSENLPEQLHSPMTEVLHLLFTIGDIFCRSEPLPDWTMLTTSPGEAEMMSRQRLYEKCQPIEDTIDTAPHYVFLRQRESQAVLHQIMNGCRALTAYWVGKHDEALTHAVRSIQNAHNVDQDIVLPWQLYANAYAIMVCIVLMQRDYYLLGMEHFLKQSSCLPMGKKMLERLYEMSNHADVEVSRFQLIGSVPTPFSSPGGVALAGSSNPPNATFQTSPMRTPLSPNASNFGMTPAVSMPPHSPSLGPGILNPADWTPGGHNNGRTNGQSHFPSATQLGNTFHPHLPPMNGEARNRRTQFIGEPFTALPVVTGHDLTPPFKMNPRLVDDFSQAPNNVSDTNYFLGGQHISYNRHG